MHLVHRKTCRVCGSGALTRVISLGEQYLQGAFVKPSKALPPLRKIPMNLVRCDPTLDEKACGLLQMEHSVPPNILYSTYWYRSGTNETMSSHLRGIVTEVLDLIPQRNLKVIDIGCNDGTLLKYYPSDFQKYGVDPSDIALEIEPPVKVIQDTFPSKELLEQLKGDNVDVVTSIAMFYDLEEPIAFCRAIQQILSEHGVWIFEMSYMPTMLAMNSYDTICHEHLEYYSLSVIEYILKQTGLKIFNVSINDINGGSIRCYATHQSNFNFKTDSFAENITKVRQKEFDLELDTDKPYRSFQDRINVHKKELNKLMKKLKKDGKKIHIYGASTKGNTILQWCGIDNSIIDFAAERNPEKYGALTLGTEIPIISEEDSRRLNPDCYLVLPWHFKKEFLERERETIQNGVSFIFPLPNIEIINKNNL